MLCQKIYLWPLLRRKILRQWSRCILTYRSFTYNSFTTWSTVIDTLMEPLFWIVDHFLKYMGPVFVTLVAILTTSVVLIFYTCLLPHKYELSLGWTLYHLVFGHWLLVNIVFHYIKAAFTLPGSPPKSLVVGVILLLMSGIVIGFGCLLPHKLDQSIPWTVFHFIVGHWFSANILFHYFKAAFTDPGRPGQDIPEVVSICKKCIAPKPPRAHHCSVCNRCVLKMDHHCPWLNNCVGHYNHRHFFLFCVYMWMGTVYVTVAAYDLFKQHFYEIRPQYFVDSTGQHTDTDPDIPDPNDHHVSGLSDESGQYFHHMIVYEFMLCSGVAVALGLLTLWHARLICRGETSIEVHINRKERKRLKKKGLLFRNPYNHGILRNWKIFLGVTQGRSFIRHVLLPSNHKPDGDGLQWQNASYSIDSGLMLL